ncbi:RNA polymerase sigma factor [Rhizocola hellebori]|uniref:RNA polymerase sigma factor n=1 Tax=Rhizocola hellebori TaxID=1392758 RepID=A0A8J3VH74_9ACTN|nr:RNA polymerase sigma factor [Rhizocola hellebori]
MVTQEAAALLRAAANGDAQAWSGLVRRFSGLVWSVARGHGLSQADAEDVYQTTWLRLTQHLERIKEPDRIAGWLAATARNESLRVIRSGLRVSPVENLEPALEPQGSPEEEAVQAESARQARWRAARLWEAFEELSERCKQLLRVLSAPTPPSYAEVAEVFDMPVGSIGPTRARCLARLRALLADRGITSGSERS